VCHGARRGWGNGGAWIASVTGHQSLEEIERYTRDAKRKLLAARAMRKFKT
jgi:hypothetical protein